MAILFKHPWLNSGDPETDRRRAQLQVLAITAAPAVPIALAAGGSVALAGLLRWAFTSTRLASGLSAAVPNLALQLFHNRTDWKRYNWGSVGFDYVLGASGYLFAKGVLTRWPAPLMSRAVGSMKTWLNFGKQQSAFAIYATVLGSARAYVSNTGTGGTVASANIENAMTMVRSVAMQSFLASPTGTQLFPTGWGDPRVAYLRGIISLVSNTAVRAAFGVVPTSGDAPTPARTGPVDS